MKDALTRLTQTFITAFLNIHIQIKSYKYHKMRGIVNMAS